jgi:hypothetical protein
MTVDEILFPMHSFIAWHSFMKELDIGGCKGPFVFPYFSSHSLRCEAVLLIPLSPDPLHAALFETNELDLSIAIST